MLKLALVFTFGAGTMFVAGNAGRVHHSGFQPQLFQGTALKVAPDPSNIWSFHETVKVSKNQTVVLPVVVDFDGNKKMDTELKFGRVLITDMQFSGGTVLSAHLLDDNGIRWVLMPGLGGNTHFTTPLALPIGSGLKVSIQTSQHFDTTVTINLIGRLVTM